MTKNRLKVKICGEDFTLLSTMPLAHIKKVAAYVDTEMEKITIENPKLSQKKTAILVCLNLSEQLFKLQEDVRSMEVVLAKEQQD